MEKNAKPEEWTDEGIGIASVISMLDKDDKGKTINSRKNCVIAIDKDINLSGKIRYNMLANREYICGKVPWSDDIKNKEWKEIYLDYLLLYMEKNYGLSNENKIFSAVHVVADRNKYNPFIEMLNSIKYDGKNYIEDLLPDYLGVKKNNYSTECLKLLMLAIISRAFVPGIKFDYVIILYGEQGAGKSTFFLRLCCNDEWYLENLSGINDKKVAAELIQGKLIVEFNELLAMKGAAGIEAIKSFVSLKSDEYREAYARKPEKRNRQCVFVGTTNDCQFLIDKTGNRRFLPIEVKKHESNKNLFSNEPDVSNDFIQAWGEAYEIYKSGNFSLILSDQVAETAKKMQDMYMEEDVKLGIIQNWLNYYKYDYVCTMQICMEALLIDNPDKKLIREVNQIMNNCVEGWLRGTTHRFDKLGKQRCYMRNPEFILIDEQETNPFCSKDT